MGPTCKHAQSCRFLPMSFVCTICDDKFTCDEDLQGHIDVTRMKIDFRCGMCEYLSESEDNIKKHTENQHHFLCDVCNIVFPVDEDIKKHTQTVHLNTQEKSKPAQDTNMKVDFQCEMCEYVNESEENIKKHTENNHQFPCDSCNIIFTKYEVLKQHKHTDHKMITEEPEETVRYPCDTCEKWFNKLQDLIVHRETDHGTMNGKVSVEKEYLENLKADNVRMTYLKILKHLLIVQIITVTLNLPEPGRNLE